MEPIMKQSNSLSRVNVSQLDKINAFANKSTDNTLMEDLCPEDRLYLKTLMDNDSSEADEGENLTCRSSAWPPLVQSPLMMKKGIKLKSSFKVTMSLEDISYVRPSWGISKGLRTIEINKRKRRESKSKEVAKTKTKARDKNETITHYFLTILIILLLILITLSYVVENQRYLERVFTNRIKINVRSRTLELYKPDGHIQDPIVELQFGQGIPNDLKADRCSCHVYAAETKRYDASSSSVIQGNCITCLDWAVRANLQIIADPIVSDESFCYNVRWQSYDTLFTPLIDCVILKGEKWFGLGDVRSSSWNIDQLSFNWTRIKSDFSANSDVSSDRLSFGSYAELQLFSANGVHIGGVKTDFDVSINVSQDSSETRKMCFTVSCSDKCNKIWHRFNQLDKLRYHNNILEYNICTYNSLRTLISKRFETNNGLPIWAGKPQLKANILNSSSEDPIEKEFKIEKGYQSDVASKLDVNNDGTTRVRSLESIGLIERTIFTTSAEFMPTLDGINLRQHVENIVKLALKSGSILVIDTRWETFIGSLELDIALFPKSKLLLEILHNKGFKILFTIKPYIDASIGINKLNQLFESGRLYSFAYKKDSYLENSHTPTTKESLFRRQSLFNFHQETIELAQNSEFPSIIRCKESKDGFCALLDLTHPKNRAWMIDNIKNSHLLYSEADGIQISGSHPDIFIWNDHYRDGISELAKSLVYNEGVYTLPQSSGDLGYIQLSPHRLDWTGLRSIVNSVMNLNLMGFSLVHPGSVWGDLKPAHSNQTESNKKMGDIYGYVHSENELIIRWLQVSMFLPILQFNNIAPIERYGLQELVQKLVKMRKTYIVPEFKKYLPFTPLTSHSQAVNSKMPVIRPVWYVVGRNEFVAADQFIIGPDLLVAPILSEGQRQRDIYLPSGFWRDELRHIDVRGGKWLRNYPVELNEIAWFSRAKR